MSSSNRVVLIVFIASSVLGATEAGPTAQPARPNIVLILTDDMGYADIGVHGGREIATPHIDALMRGGVRFTNGYVTGPYCSPTRAGLLTGRYQQRFGHEFNASGGPGLPLTETTIADRLRAAGYRTGIFGKWHLGADEAYRPLSRGFDEFFGFLGGQHSYLEVGVNPVLNGRTPAKAIGYLTDELGDRGIDFIRRHRARPFFLYLAFNAVHTPMQATDKYLARFATIADERRRTYAAMLAAMDDAIGRVMDTIVSEQIEDNTLIVFLNDNGGPTMAGTTINGSSNAPLRGSKRQTWEGGIRVPFALRWKGRLAPGVFDPRPVVQLDILPTALAAAGITVDPAWRLDGVNLLPFLTGAAKGLPHETLYWRLGHHMAIRRGDWKLVKTSEGPVQPSPVPFDLTGAELYNLSNDIGERRNLASSEPAKVRELADAWQRWNRELAPPLWGPGAGGGTQ
jgi:arylsulfatase A-like enzyme